MNQLLEIALVAAVLAFSPLLAPAVGAADGGIGEDADRTGEPTASPTRAEVDVARYRLYNQYTKTKTRLTKVDRQLEALIRKTPTEQVGEGAPRDLERASEQAVSLQVERDQLRKRLDEIRTRYATARRQMQEVNGGKLPPDWQELPEGR